MTQLAVAVDERSAATRWRFVVTICAGSFLLFLIQPMIARMALPRLGGAPAVWNSAMLVYQALLLGGYAYAHWLGRFAPRRQAMIHLALFAVAATMLPIGLIAATPPSGANSFVWVPWLLLVSIGPLFMVVAAQAPLIQRWFALSGGGDPYPLYAASNLGSFSGLIAYPLLVEPFVPVVEQSFGWSFAYGALVLLVAWCAWRLPSAAPTSVEAVAVDAPPVSRRSVWTWIFLAAIPSGLMLSTTLHLTTDIVAMPLLWVIPLGLYLLSFSVAFSENRRLAGFFTWIAPFVLLVAACGAFNIPTSLTMFFAYFTLLSLFAVSVVFHGALFERRPAPVHLTRFYLAMSVGGVLGGLFCALIAPILFNWTYEHPLLMLASALVVGAASPFAPIARRWADRDTAARFARWGFVLLIFVSLAAQEPFGLPTSRPLVVAVIAVLFILAVLAIGNRWLFVFAVGALMLGAGGWDTLARSFTPGEMTRSFFGVYTVSTAKDGTRVLVHGTTVHGVERRGTPALERSPTTYYVPGSGVGLALAAAPALFGDTARIGVVGLGTGTLACYAQPGQRWTIYEIDPAIADIARRQFSFLSRCLPTAPILIGDARLTLEQQPDDSADILIIDAFSSDAVPLHLLTREAFASYRRHLAPNGLLMVHITNRFLSMEPVIAAAASAGWSARLRRYTPDPRGVAAYQAESTWIALSPSGDTIARLTGSQPRLWRPLKARPGFAPWTDDHASILSVLR